MFLVTLALTCLPQGTHTPTLQMTAASAPYFEATSPIEIPSRDDPEAKEWTNFDLVRAYELSTGHVIVATSDAEKILSRRPTLCDDSQTIAPGDVQVHFEKLMAGSDLVLLPSTEAAPRLVVLATRSSGKFVHMPLEPHLIDWTETRWYSNRAASLFRTIVPVQGADARALCNELRGRDTAENAFEITTLGGTNCVLVQGSGIEVARLTEVLRAPARRASLEMPALKASEPALERDTSGDGEFADLQFTIPARGEGAWSVADLCVEYSRLTGVLVTVDSGDETLAKSIMVGFSEDLRIEGFNVSHTFEILCRVKGFYLSPEENGKALTLLHMGFALDQRAVVVPQKIEDIASWSFHPARLVEVDIPFKELDPSIVSDQLRALPSVPRFVGDYVTRFIGTGHDSRRGHILTITCFASTAAGNIALIQRAEELAEALRTADSNREK